MIWAFFKFLTKFLASSNYVPFMLLFMLRQDVNFCRINVLTSLKSLLKTVSQVAYMIDAVLR